MKYRIVVALVSVFTLVQCTPTKSVTIKEKPPKAESMVSSDCGDGKQWVPGYWYWKKDDFVWIKGKCVKKKEGHIYMPGIWQKDFEGNYTFAPGGWKAVGTKLEKK